MPKDELSLFSYEVLGLVGRTGAAPHDLLRLAQRDRMFVWAGESQYYVEPHPRPPQRQPPASGSPVVCL